MRINLTNTKLITTFTVACLLFLSSCVVITTKDVRPSVTEKAVIRAKCLNYVYGCSNCGNNTVNPKKVTVESVLNKKDLVACMTHYHEQLRSWRPNWSTYSTNTDYKSQRIENKIKEKKLQQVNNEKSPAWIP